MASAINPVEPFFMSKCVHHLPPIYLPTMLTAHTAKWVSGAEGNLHIGAKSLGTNVESALVAGMYFCNRAT